ncbi:MAG TPA: iron uptake system protein EfeO [Microbacteriaceae bacterium]|nr:iron uptake system protein EfeO [Microbacteriaceae bacterium]
MSTPRVLAAATAVGLTAVALAGCVPNNPTGARLAVAITDDTCVVSEATAAAGNITFSIANTGTDVNEFEIFAEDQLRIVGEKENVTPGQTIDYVVQLQPGTYYTACKFQQIGSPIGVAAFTVTGEAVTVAADEQAQIDLAVANYIAYIKSQTEELLPAVEAFAADYAAGNDDAARDAFALVRSYYERIEPTAEAFGDLDPKIDYREVDAVAEGLDWTGFHRIEKDLWVPAEGDLNSDGEDAWLDWEPSTPAQRQAFADGLVADVQELYDLVHAADFSVGIADISNGAIGLLDEVSAGKITGEEDWWSHTDLADFAANVDGAWVAFGVVKDIAASKGEEGAALVADIESEFEALRALLATYGNFETGFTAYDQVTNTERQWLSDGVNALAEPLSQLTHTVLGIAE